MQDAKDRTAPAARANYSAQLPTPAGISNRNTPEFRICPNPNKTQHITISNRNIKRMSRLVSRHEIRAGSSATPLF
jgi:hypothetical protein